MKTMEQDNFRFQWQVFLTKQKSERLVGLDRYLSREVTFGPGSSPLFPGSSMVPHFTGTVLGLPTVFSPQLAEEGGWVLLLLEAGDMWGRERLGTWPRVKPAGTNS